MAGGPRDDHGGCRARRVARQGMHNWLRRYLERGMVGLVDRSKRPRHYPHGTHARAEIKISRLVTAS
jgi:hypothetical protein